MSDKRFTLYLEIEGRTKIVNHLEKPELMEFLRNTLDNLHSNGVARIHIAPCLSAGEYGRM